MTRGAVILRKTRRLRSRHQSKTFPKMTSSSEGLEDIQQVCAVPEQRGDICMIMTEIKPSRLELGSLNVRKFPSQQSEDVQYLNDIILRSNEAFAIFN